jgi:hypothetical protein
MAIREVDVTGIREALRARLAEQAGVDHRKTAREYVRAAEAAGLIRDEGVAQLTDELIDQVVQAVRPAWASGHGTTGGVAGRAGADRRVGQAGPDRGEDRRQVGPAGCGGAHRTLHA